jgi:ribosomal protein S18 acetylase RimI-like enzyme
MAGPSKAIRRALRDDLEDIVAIDHLAASGDEARMRALRQWVEDGECLVHTTLGIPDGFVIVRPRHFFERDFVDLLEVAPAARRSGVGTSLMNEAIARAGTPQLFTSTNRSNLSMQGLLNQSGWHFSGELEGLDPGDPELVFSIGRPNPEPGPCPAA